MRNGGSGEPRYLHRVQHRDASFVAAAGSTTHGSADLLTEVTLVRPAVLIRMLDSASLWICRSRQSAVPFSGRASSRLCRRGYDYAR